MRGFIGCSHARLRRPAPRVRTCATAASKSSTAPVMRADSRAPWHAAKTKAAVSRVACLRPRHADRGQNAAQPGNLCVAQAAHGRAQFGIDAIPTAGQSPRRTHAAAGMQAIAIHVEVRRQLAARRRRGGCRPCLEGRGCLPQNLDAERFFASKMVIQAGFANADLIRDVLEAETQVGARANQASRDSQYL